MNPLKSGNIINKTDAGNYVYRNDKIHAVAYITNPAGPTAPPISISPALQTISYTPFQKTATITEGSVQNVFSYGPDYQRNKMEYWVSNNLNTTKYYYGDYERILNNTHREIIYVSAGDGLCAVIEKYIYGSSYHHFVYTDYLGSLLTITNNNGNIEGEQNFDAWGRNRNPTNWQYAGTSMTPVFFDRGYTGHEHLQNFNLINMNGRIYDPIQGRMLSPDNLVGNPWSTQGYNRYSYANNNPLVYTDPDGNFAWFAFAIGAAFGAWVGGSVANNGELAPWEWEWGSSRTWSYVLGGAIIGGFSAAAGAYVASAGIMPFANTAGIVTSSFFSSIGMNIMTDGAIPVTASFGIGSFNFQTGELDYLFKAGNSGLENFGYGFGALVNFQDAIAGFSRANRGDVTVLSEKGKTTTHSAVYSEDTKVDISVCGTEGTNYDKTPNGMDWWDYLRDHRKPQPGAYYPDYTTDGPKIKLYNVNTKILERLTTRLRGGKLFDGRSPLVYGGLRYGCMGHTTTALWRAGVLTLPNLHPHMLYAQLLFRETGIHAAPFLTNYR